MHRVGQWHFLQAGYCGLFETSPWCVELFCTFWCTKPFQFIFCFPSSARELAMYVRSVVSFSRQWYVETKIWALIVLIVLGVTLLLGPLSEYLSYLSYHYILISVSTPKSICVFLYSIALQPYRVLSIYSHFFPLSVFVNVFSQRRDLVFIIHAYLFICLWLKYKKYSFRIGNCKKQTY